MDIGGRAAAIRSSEEVFVPFSCAWGAAKPARSPPVGGVRSAVASPPPRRKRERDSTNHLSLIHI